MEFIIALLLIIILALPHYLMILRVNKLERECLETFSIVNGNMKLFLKLMGKKAKKNKKNKKGTK